MLFEYMRIYVLNLAPESEETIPVYLLTVRVWTSRIVFEFTKTACVWVVSA